MRKRNMSQGIKTLHEQLQNVPEQTVAKVALGIGGSGTLYDLLTDLTGWVDLLIKYGNGLLVLGGVYLMVHNVVRKVKKSRKKKRREGDRDVLSQQKEDGCA